MRILKRDLRSLKTEISLKQCFIDLNHVCYLLLIRNNEAILKHKQVQGKKLNNLRATRLQNCSHDPDKVTYNFSDYKLTEREQSVLSKVLKFAIPPSKLEYADFMLPFGLLFCDIKSNDL